MACRRWSPGLRERLERDLPLSQRLFPQSVYWVSGGEDAVSTEVCVVSLLVGVCGLHIQHTPHPTLELSAPRQAIKKNLLAFTRFRFRVPSCHALRPSVLNTCPHQSAKRTLTTTCLHRRTATPHASVNLAIPNPLLPNRPLTLTSALHE